MINTDYKRRIWKIWANFSRLESRDIDPLNAMTGLHQEWSIWAPGLMLKVYRHFNLTFWYKMFDANLHGPKIEKKKSPDYVQ